MITDESMIGCPDMGYGANDPGFVRIEVVPFHLSYGMTPSRIAAAANGITAGA